MRSNCWIVAKLFYRRLKRKGLEPYWAKRWSRKAPCWHYLVSWRLPSGYMHTISFKPIQKLKRRFPPLLFVGKVEWGDWADTVSVDR